MKKYLFLSLLLLLAAASQAQNTRQYYQGGDTLKLTINYLYEVDQTVAAPAYFVDTLAKGESYSVTSPTIPGHHPDKEVVQGRMPDHDVTETVLYLKNKHSVTVDPNLAHGTITVSPSGEINVGDVVTLTATPENFYVLDELKAYNKDDESQTVTISDNSFAMPDFDVIVTALFSMLPPVINNDIEAPQAICSGTSLSLVIPSVANATDEGWQLAPDQSFQIVQDYTGQTLDGSYNGWKLRYWASNSSGMVYSNVVAITVVVIEPSLTGDLQLCSMQAGSYEVQNAGNALLTWSVSDADAILVETGKTLKVTWVNEGEQTVTLKAEDAASGCSATTTLTVHVVSFVDHSDLQSLVVKKNNGRPYILIYPNPKDTYKYQWYKDNEPIKGANGQYYYQAGGLEAGVYKLYLSFNADATGHLFGGAFTESYTVTAPVTLNLYPNPAQADEGIRIMNENGGEIAVSVYSIDGRLLYRQTVSGTQPALHLGLPQGIYVVNMTDQENNTYNEKLIIK